jgi:formate hydrogenlyase transcriptional activator
MRILYVEDNPSDADLTRRALQKTAPSIELELTPTIERALTRLSRLSSEPLDLVLTDMNLKDGDGLSLLRHIRESAMPVAVVVVTGVGDEETAVSALKARADDYVVKQKDYLHRLPAILESALNHYRVESARRTRQLNVLYVEQQRIVSEETRHHLALNADYIHLTPVSTAREALSLLEDSSSHPYDVLLLDLELPELKAFELLRELQGRDLPVVLVCNPNNEELASQCQKRGAASYLVKRPGYLYQLPWELEDAHSKAEMVRREVALAESEARNRAILNAIPDMMFLQSRDGKYLDYHARHPSSLMVPPEMFLGKKISDVLPPELAQKFLLCFEQTSDKPVLLEYDLPISGGTRFYEASMVSCDDDKILTIVRDITDRRESEVALRKSEERLRLAQQAARVGSWEWDVRTGASVWSDMIWELLGLEPDNQPVTVERFLEFIHPDDRATVWGKVSQLLADGGDYYDEFRIVQRNGHVLWLSSKGRVIRSPDGRAQKILGVNIDITDLKLAEASLKSALQEVQQLKDQLQEENIYLQEEVRGASHFGEIIGQSPALKRVLRQAQQVAPLNTNVLILGETGTGKELLARAIHNLSPRRNHTLVKINCAALPAPLIESELFGHARGAFTGADSQRRGRFELANDGTMFLDEVAELPLDLQAKLLRVLEYGEFEMVGSNRTIKVDVRVIAATNRDLSEAVATGSFRSDLYYRLSSFPITLPLLRERSEDLPLLVSHLAKQLSLKLGKPIEKIPQHTMSALQNYSWPGNVRELRNVIERAIIVSQGSKLELAESLESPGAETRHHVIEVRDPETTLDDSDTLQRSESKLILRTLKKVHWRIEGPGGAAELLDVHPSTLRSRMKKLGIDRPRIQASL